MRLFPPPLYLVRIGLFLLAVAFLACMGLDRLYWGAELFTHFVPHYVPFALLLAALFFHYRRRVELAVVLLLGVYFLSQARLLWMDGDAPGAGEKIKIVQFNVNWFEQQVEPRTDWVLKQADADVLVLIELNDEWNPTLEKLSALYPAHFDTAIRGWRRIAVFSRLPESRFSLRHVGVDGAVADNLPPIPGHAQGQYYVVLNAKAPDSGKGITLYAIHPPPPTKSWAADMRNELLMHVASEIGKDESPYRVVVGDFNVTRWSYWYKETLRRSGLKNSFAGYGLLNTWPVPFDNFMGIAIDHLLVSPEIAVTAKATGPADGSDHAPVLTELELR